MFSKDFFIIFSVSAIKCGTCYIYGSLFKEIGIYFINDDIFVTMTAIIGMLLNSFLRFFMGKLIRFFGIKKVYIINVLILAIGNISMVNFGNIKKGFFFSLIINRIGQGILYSLNNFKHLLYF